jgi:hypothetical protein
MPKRDIDADSAIGWRAWWLAWLDVLKTTLVYKQTRLSTRSEEVIAEIASHNYSSMMCSNRVREWAIGNSRFVEGLIVRRKVTTAEHVFACRQY